MPNQPQLGDASRQLSDHVRRAIGAAIVDIEDFVRHDAPQRGGDLHHQRLYVLGLVLHGNDNAQFDFI